jgi:DNA-binding PadR family transcriptional regulator
MTKGKPRRSQRITPIEITAREIAAVLSDRPPMTPLEISRTMRAEHERFKRLQPSGVLRVLAEMAEKAGIVQLPDGRWTISE